jgi:ppGpp synthetase/RelA/SpoT-type nucleotidyltranferase
VRISLYFPSKREDVDRIINEAFIVGMSKSFPEKGNGRKKGKSNPGYWANHYRVYLKDEDYSGKFRKTPVEIQVTSVLMHSWAEIEHDLVYKPKNGKLSWKEHKILAGLNALIIAGEIALEKLQKAISERISARKTLDKKNKVKRLNKPDQA